MPSPAAVLLALICLAALGCGPSPSPHSPASAGRKSGTLRFFDIVNLDVRDVPLMMALDALEADGYTVEKTYMASSTLIAEALARGDADIGLLNNQTMWLAITKGAGARTIAQFTAATFVLAAKKEFRTCGDLDGRRVGTPGTKGLSPALLDLSFKQQCPDMKPQMLVILESTGRSAALLAGELDATILPGEELIKLERQAPGRFHALISLREQFPDVQIDCLHARTEWAEANPELVKDLLRALLQVHRRIAEDPRVLVDESVKRLGLDPETAREVGEAHLRAGLWDPNGGITPGTIQHTLDFMASIKTLPAGLRVEDVADFSYLDAVVGELGRR